LTELASCGGGECAIGATQYAGHLVGHHEIGWLAAEAVGGGVQARVAKSIAWGAHRSISVETLGAFR
jgi:hypothetical protein